jgi:hypothetical protein
MAYILATSRYELAFVKIGFHVGMGGNIEGLYEYMEALDAAGVPFFPKPPSTPRLRVDRD